MGKNIPKIVNPEPIEVEVQDLNGKITRLEVKTVTTKLMQDLTNTKDGLDTDPVGTLTNQMGLLFGEEVDYSNFDMRVLRSALSYCMDELRTPIKRQDG